MKLNDIQALTLELEDIDSIEDVGYKNCVDIEVEDDNTFTLSNGIISHNSAMAGLVDGLGRSQIGYFATRGVPLNAYDAKVSRIAENKELENIIKILNLKLGAVTQDINYNYIMLANDADCFEEHTKILTKRGNIEIKDIQYGDECLTHTGEWKPIIDIIERKKEKSIKIYYNNSYIWVGEYHKMLVYRDNKVQIIFAKDLKTTDKLLEKK